MKRATIFSRDGIPQVHFNPGLPIPVLETFQNSEAICAALPISETFFASKQIVYENQQSGSVFIYHCISYWTMDSISSRFNVLNMPISTTAPIDAKTHV
jgi:hypothetical protein